MRLARLAPLLLVLLGSCAEPPGSLFESRILAFGTLVDLTIWGVDPDVAQEAAAAITRELTLMNDAWHAWRPGTLGDVNEKLAAGEPFHADPAVLPLIRQAAGLARASGHRFNPAAARLFALWGFHSDDPAGPPPDADAVALLVARNPTMDDISINGDLLQCDNPAVKLDFGGFAKGYGIDRMIELLRGRGIHNAIVNAGGDLRAIGTRGDRPWRIGIRHPRRAAVLASLDTQGDESIFTSGDYERYYEHDGRRYHHIIDPRSGYPARDAISVTVVHDNAAEADAAATALMVAGRDEWHGVAKRMGIHYVMLTDGDGVVHMNPAMAHRVRFRDPQPTRVEISPPLLP